MNEFERIIQT